MYQGKEITAITSAAARQSFAVFDLVTVPSPRPYAALAVPTATAWLADVSQHACTSRRQGG
jgi:hypothetical protein